jgi:hypothetical protein
MRTMAAGPDDLVALAKPFAPKSGAFPVEAQKSIRSRSK